MYTAVPMYYARIRNPSSEGGPEVQRSRGPDPEVQRSRGAVITGAEVVHRCRGSEMQQGAKVYRCTGVQVNRLTG